MPTTRAARAAARGATRAAERQLIDLPPDALSLVLYQLTLAHDIAAVAPTCHALCDAVKLAMKARPFSGEVVKLSTFGAMYCLAATPDGRVITGSSGEVKVWRDGACERTITAHTRAIWAVAVLPGSARFVSGSSDTTAKLWTLDGALERTFQVGSTVLCVAALPDGVHFVVGLGGDGSWNGGPNKGDIRQYHVDGTLVHTFKGHAHDVNAVAVTPDGQHIISGSWDRTVKVWSVASKSLVSTCIGHDFIMAVAAMPDGQRFLSGSADDTVRVWLLNGTHHTFKLHTSPVNALVALPDNQHALSASTDKTVKLFNVNDGRVLRTFTHHTNWVRSLALHPDGLRFISGSEDRTARIAYHGLAPRVGSAN